MTALKEKLKAFFKNKRVLILGYGREGRSTFELIQHFDCAEIAVADRNPLDDDELSGRTLYCGENYLRHIGDYDIIMKAPGIGLKNSISDEIKKKITGQTDLFLRFADCKVIGVTGTKGKSTTSTLIHHFIKANGFKTMLIGNIGVPPLSKCDLITPETVVVFEMSCHQLEYVKASPNVSVLLNIYPEHLDHYVDFEAYKAAKLNIFRYQDEKDMLICFNENKSDVKTKARTVYAGFSCGDIGTKDGGIFLYDTFLPSEKIKTRLKGEHNLYNTAVALAAAEAVGCNIELCLDRLPDFSGLPHRLEVLGRINGVEYVNDSISTAPETAVAALKAFPDTDTIIVGGMDRGISYDFLTDYLNENEPIKTLIVLPDSGKRVAEGITSKKINIIAAKDMAEAVKAAKEHTKVRCILSPAAASYGFYKNFEERGDHFRILLGF